MLARLTSAANDTDVPERLRDLIPQPREEQDGKEPSEWQAAAFERAPTAADHLADALNALSLEDGDTQRRLLAKQIADAIRDQEQHETAGDLVRRFDPSAAFAPDGGPANETPGATRPPPGSDSQGGTMETEFAVLAASGATTLVSLMVTDSWGQARALVGRLFSRTGAGSTTVADLDADRARLLAGDADDTQATREVEDRWRADLYRLLQTDSVTVDDLYGVLSSLQQLVNTSAARPVPVHNAISGGVQHGPVIQSGRITGLTFHVHGPGLPVQD